MKNDINQIGFRLSKISTEQFAMLDIDIDKQLDIGLGTQIGFGLDEKNKSLIVIAQFKFQQEKNTFLIIEVACHFRIADNTWSSIINDKKKSIKFPKDLVSHLVVITVGTTRGVLHARTENTKYNEFILPTVNVNSLITSDLQLEFSDFSKESA